MSLWLAHPGEIATLLRWLLWSILCGWLAYPLARHVGPELTPFARIVLAKILGWAVAGYGGWLLSALGLIVFQTQASLGGLLVLGLVCVLGWRPADRLPALRPLLLTEALFVALFLMGLAQRLAMPDLAGLEKPTNLSFLAALSLAGSMPPEDAWAAGLSVNYYYLGHAITAVFTQFASALPDHGYQLGMATVFALTGLGVAAIVQTVLAPLGRTVATLLAAFAGAAALYAGNLHSFLYTVFRPWMPTTKEAFWYPDSTRFIGFDPPTDDRGFTEFTGYAFKVGDLHAHVLATPTFLAAVLVMVSMIARACAGGRPGHPASVTLGGLIGLAYGINAWDVAILGLFALCLWLALAVHGGRRSLDHMLAVALGALAAAVLVPLPFAAGFLPFGEGIAAVSGTTPLWQLLAVHGAALPAALGLVFLGLTRRGRGRGILPLVVGGALFLWGLALIALPEFVRVVDIYASDHARANTMFKLTFRAHTLLLVGGVIGVGLLLSLPGRGAVLAGLIALAPLASTFVYLEYTFALPRAGQSLDGLRHLGPRRDMARFLARVPWPEGGALIEAPSDSFSDGAALATASGRPSVLGWAGHIRLWHAAPGFSRSRHADVSRFYAGADLGERCRLIARYNIVYIAVSSYERDAFPELPPDAFQSFGHVAYDGPGGRLVAVDRAACDRGGASGS